MSVAHVATESAAATAGTDDGVTVNVPAGVTDGDILLCWISNALQVAITPPAGWTVLAVMSGINAVYFGYRIADSEPASYTWTWTDSRGTGIIAAFSGVHATRPILTWAIENRATSADQLAPALSPFATDPTAAMLVSFMNWDIGGRTTTAPSGWTIPTNGNPDSTTATGSGVESAVAYFAYTGGSGIGTADWNGTETRTSQIAQLALIPDDSTDELLAAWYGAAASSGSATALALAMPPDHGAGDLLLAIVGWRGDSVTASIDGWTEKGHTDLVDASSDYHLGIWYRYATSAAEAADVDLSAANAVTAVTLMVRRTGASGDPFAAYVAANDTTSDTANDVPALTMAAEPLIVIAAASRRADSAITAIPSGYASVANPATTTPLVARPSSTAGYAAVGAAIAYQETADHAAVTFTSATGDVSVGLAAAIGLGSAAGGSRGVAIIL